MLKNYIKTFIIVVLLCFVTGCSSSEDDNKENESFLVEDNTETENNYKDEGITEAEDKKNNESSLDTESDKSEAENDQQSNDTVETEPHKYFFYEKRVTDSEDEEGIYLTYLYDLTDYRFITDLNRATGFQCDVKGRLLFINEGNLCILDPSENDSQKIIDTDVEYFKANRDFSKIIYKKTPNDNGLYEIYTPTYVRYNVDYSGLYYYNTVSDHKFYLGDMVSSTIHSGCGFLVSSDFETVYFPDNKVRLAEWNLDKGLSIVDERDVWHSFVEAWYTAFIDESDILYYYRYEGDKCEVYKKEINKNPEIILTDVNMKNTVADKESGLMYLEKKIISRVRNIPIAISADRFEELIEEMEKLDSKYHADEIKSRYRKFETDRLSEMDIGEKDYIIEKYPEVLNEDIYVLRDYLKDRVKLEIEEAFNAIGFDVENDIGVYGNLSYVEGSEIYYYNPKTAPVAELLYKTENAISINEINNSHLTIGFVDYDEEGNRLCIIMVDGKKVKINEDLIFGVYSYSGHESEDFIEILYEGKVFTINNISGSGELTYTVSDYEDWYSYFEMNKITKSNAESVNFDQNGYEMVFIIGSELYVNDELVDDGVLDYEIDRKENADQKAFVYLKRIPISEYELSYYNMIHKNILMYYDNGNVTEICRDVSRPTLFGDQIIFIKRFPDEEYLGELCIWDKNTNSIRIIDSGISGYYTPLWAEIGKKCIPN